MWKSAKQAQRQPAQTQARVATAQTWACAAAAQTWQEPNGGLGNRNLGTQDGLGAHDDDVPHGGRQALKPEVQPEQIGHAWRAEGF